MKHIKSLWAKCRVYNLKAENKCSTGGVLKDLGAWKVVCLRVRMWYWRSYLSVGTPTPALGLSGGAEADVSGVLWFVAFGNVSVLNVKVAACEYATVPLVLYLHLPHLFNTHYNGEFHFSNYLYRPFSIFLPFLPFSYIHSFHWRVQNATIPCSSQELLPFLSVIYFFPATLLRQLFFHPLSPHLVIYFLVYLSILLFPNSYIIPFWEFYFLPFSIHAQTNIVYLTLLSLL